MPADKPAGTTLGAKSLAWWRKYLDPEKGDPATRARLRRSQSPLDAATIREALVLVRMIGAWSNDGINEAMAKRALNLARVLAHVKDPSGERPMRAAGWRRFPGDRSGGEVADDRPVLSELRFRRLLTTPRGEEQVTAFSRLVDMLDGRVHLGELANDFWYWNSRTKERWAFDYFAASSAAARELSTTAGDDE